MMRMKSLMKKIKSLVPNFIRIPSSALIAFLVVALVFSFVMLDRNQRRYETMLNEQAERRNIVETTLDGVVRHTESLQRTLDLAVEFGYDPSVVIAVEYYAGMAYNEFTDEMKRFLPNEQALTYFLLSMIYTESKGDMRASGDNGRAYGLTQMWYTTARMYDEDLQASELYNIDTHMKLAMEHFSHLLKRYRGNVLLAIDAWNKGEGNVDPRFNQPNGYIEKVFSASIGRNRFN